MDPSQAWAQEESHQVAGDIVAQWERESFHWGLDVDCSRSTYLVPDTHSWDIPVKPGLC